VTASFDERSRAQGLGAGNGAGPEAVGGVAAGTGRPQTSKGGAAPVYGALDLGTNNCRLLLARPHGRGFKVVDAFSRIIRLGEGVSESRRLSDAAMARTIEALKVCTEKMARRDVRRARLIATEACRLAENGADFVAEV
jgi:exopolyphosphatase/guanosine-5'-triphosphate,3'-diphosphate pyrophosphatase